MFQRVHCSVFRKKFGCIINYHLIKIQFLNPITCAHFTSYYVNETKRQNGLINDHSGLQMRTKYVETEFRIYEACTAHKLLKFNSIPGIYAAHLRYTHKHQCVCKCTHHSQLSWLCRTTILFTHSKLHTGSLLAQL